MSLSLYDTKADTIIKLCGVMREHLSDDHECNRTIRQIIDEDCVKDA